MLNIIICLLGGYIILKYIYNVSPKKSVLVSAYLVFAGWINGPNVTTIPANAGLVLGPVSYNFLLYSKLGFAYTIISALVLLALTYYIEKPIEKLKMSADDTVKKYDDFIKNASQLYVIGKDIDFLKSSSVQKEAMKSLGKKCKVLCTSLENNKMLDIYKELLDSKVNIRNYGDIDTENQIYNLRGQLKETQVGIWEGFFVQQSSNNEYEEIKIDNQFILKSLKKEFDKVHANGANPIIKCIALDLGGVYFDGDYNKDFVEKLNRELNLNVIPNSRDTLILDDNLNLGKISIVECWEQKTGKTFTDSEKDIIRSAWSRVWRPNKEIKRVMDNLAENGYKVVPFSNLDKENGEMYIIRHDFEKFKSDYYFSYKYEMLKPDKKFFELIMQKEGCKSYEILLIDDKIENIHQAKELGWNTIQFNIDNGEKTLIEELKKLNLRISKDIGNTI